MMHVLTLAATRVASWHATDAATLATKIQETVAFDPCGLAELQREAVANGADVGDLRKVWDWPEWVRRIEANALAGEALDVQDLWTLRPSGLVMLSTSEAAVQAAIDARKLRVVDVAARDVGQPVPAALDAAAVTAALNGDGYAWNGSAWIKS